MSRPTRVESFEVHYQVDRIYCHLRRPGDRESLIDLLTKLREDKIPCRVYRSIIDLKTGKTVFRIRLRHLEVTEEVNPYV